MTLTSTLRAAALLLMASCVHAAGQDSVSAASATQLDPCRATVLRFEQALSILRQSQGNRAGEDLKEKLMPAKLQSEILLKDGYCGLARYIREKKLER